MFEERRITWRRRISRAVMVMLLNVILWIVIPSLLLSYLAGLTPSSSGTIEPASVYAFGFAIAGLQVLGALTEGMTISVPFVTGSYVTMAYYFYQSVNGGTLDLVASGIGISLWFQPLIYLLMLPILMLAIRTPLIYLADDHEAARPASNRV